MRTVPCDGYEGNGYCSCEQYFHIADGEPCIGDLDDVDQEALRQMRASEAGETRRLVE